MSQTGKLEAIWLKRMKGGPMDAHETAVLQANKGIVGNANQGGKYPVLRTRQVNRGALKLCQCWRR